MDHVQSLERRERKMDSLKVSSRSNPNLVAGALVAVICEKGYAEMQAVGQEL